MGFRFRKSIKILPGVRVNIGKTGVSTTVGRRGASVTISERGTSATVGIPGTGIAYSQKIAGPVVNNDTVERTNYSQERPTADKDKLTAALLALFLGGFGVHRFYLGQIGLGIAYLLFCWTFIPAIIGFIDFIILLSCSEQNFKTKYIGPSLVLVVFLSCQLAFSQSYSWTSKYVKANTLYVRDQPGKEGTVVDTLQQYERVMIRGGQDITKGWVEVKLNDSLSDNTSAFVYGPLLMDELPSADEYIDSKGKIVSYTKKQAYNNGIKYYRGPRGGCFYYTSSGRKQYVDRSYCNGQ